jgi:hypothetical protein
LSCDCGGVAQVAHPVLLRVDVDATIVELAWIAARGKPVYGEDAYALV